MKPVLLQACCLSVGTRRCPIVWASAWANWMEAACSSSSLDCWAGKQEAHLSTFTGDSEPGSWKWAEWGGFPAGSHINVWPMIGATKALPLTSVN